MKLFDKLKGQTILSAFLWQYFSFGLRSIIQLVVLAILSRLLTPKDFGLVSITSIFTNLGQLISQLGVGPAIVQKEIIDERQIRVGFSLSLVFGLVLFFPILIFAPEISLFFNSTEIQYFLPVIGLSFFISSIGTVSLSLLQKQLRFKELMWVDLGSYFISYGIVGISLALLGQGAWALIYAQLIQATLSSVFAIILCPHSFIPLFSKKEISNLLFFGFGFTLARFFNYAANQGDYFVVGKFMGPDLLGSYSRAYQIMLFPAQYLGATLEKVFFPVFSKYQSNQEKLKNLYLMGTYLLSILCVPIIVVIFWGAPGIVDILLGPQWKAVIIPLQIFALGIQFRTTYKIGDSVAKGSGKVYQRSVRELIYAIFVIIGAAVGLNWGINGVSLGVLIAIILNFIMVSNMSIKILDIPIKDFWATQWPGLLLTTLIMVFLLPINYLLYTKEINSILVLILNSFITILLFITIPIMQPRFLGVYRKDSVTLLARILPTNFIETRFIHRILARLGGANAI